MIQMVVMGDIELYVLMDEQFQQVTTKLQNDWSCKELGDIGIIDKRSIRFLSKISQTTLFRE